MKRLTDIRLTFTSFLICTVFAITALFSLIQAAHAELPENISIALKNSGLGSDQVSIFIQPLSASPALLATPLIEYRADVSLNPASNMKLLTSYAALALLGPAYRWKTEAYIDGKLINGVLYGDLYFKGYGDPDFSQADFWQLIHQLRRQGLKEIKGDIVIDQSYFASQSPDAGQFDGEALRAYNATPAAFIVQGKTSSFRFDADATEIKVQAEPYLKELSVINLLKPNQQACNAWRNDLRYEVSNSAAKDGGSAAIIFNGSFPANCGEKYLELMALSENDYHLYLFRNLWGEAGGIFAGKLRIKDIPGTAFKFSEHVSESLSQTLPEINKWSNNLMAKQLLLTIAAEKNDLPATEAKAAIAIKTWLDSIGLHFNELVIDNGSGLSRLERISARHLGTLLLHAYYSPVMPELMASLPILGIDGTMQKRMNNSVALAHGHLKTGSINNVYSVAGYMLGQSGQRYVVVFMVNDEKAGFTRATQDELLEWTYLH